MHTLARTSLSTLALVGALTWASSAAAQPGTGAIRLGADVPVLTLQHFPDPDQADPPDPSFAFGLWGTDLFVHQVGASVGYQLTDALVLGGRVGFGVYVVDTGGFFGGNNTTGLFSLLPFVEYMFGSGDLRPFVGGQVGFQAIFPEDADAQAWFIGGAMGGLHFFAADGFSISPTLFFDFLYRGDYERAGYDLIFAVSFEGWMGGSGGGPEPAPAADPVPAESGEPTWQPPPEQGSTGAPPPPAGDPEGGLQ
jgi:hypothetical protein